MQQDADDNASTPEPTPEQDAPQRDLHDEDGQLRTRGRLAVIEDDETSRHFLTQSLRAHGYFVKGIEDGASALPLLRVYRPDIVLLDVTLPGMTGFDVCRLIRRDPLLRHTTVILLTGRAGPTDRMAGWSAGADDYLIKPCEISELLARIAAHLRARDNARRQWLNPVTQLPAPAALQEELVARLQRGESFAACYADIEHFKSYNDRYGYLAGDTLLTALADMLRSIVADLNDVAREQGMEPTALAGHLGSDDFLLLVAPEQALHASSLLVQRFAELAPSLYRVVDRERGWIPGLSRHGAPERFPLVTLTVSTVVRHPGDLDLANEDALASIATDLWQQLRDVARHASA